MALDKHEVWVGAPDQATTGAILSSATLKPKPTGVDDALTGFLDSGYINEDGLSIGTNKKFEEIKDWNLDVIRKILSEYSHEVKWTAISQNEQAWKNFAGDKNVKATPATSSHGKQLEVAFSAEEPLRKSWAFKIKDGSRKMLIYVPDGQAQGDGDLEFKKNSAIGLPILLTTFPDAEGKHIYIFLDDGVVSA